MRPRYRIPAGEAQSELVVRNSVFVGMVGPAANVEAARAFVARARAKCPDANHHPWAYTIEEDPQGLYGFSDAGEPGGTAGRPMLAVLQGTGMNQMVAVVARYFGGTKLGTGGLVRAYSGAVRLALQGLPTRELLLHRMARIVVDYSVYGNLRYVLPRLGVQVGEPSYGEQVTMVLAVPEGIVGEADQLLRDLTSGRVRLDSCWEGYRYSEV